MSYSFVHLKTHSAYSLSEGAIPVKRLPFLCKKFHMPAIALTDQSNLFGALEFSLTCIDQGIQPIIGCLVTSQMGVFTLLVQNEVGYKNLLSIVSESYLKHPDNPIIELTQTNGLIALVGESLLVYSHYFIDLFKDRLYVDLERHPQSLEREAQLLSLALEKNLPLVATNDIYFDQPEMHEAHDALLCISKGVYVATQERKRVSPHHYFKSAKEMEDLFSDLPEAIENTINIAKRCSFAPRMRSPILPTFCEDEAFVLQKKANEGLLIRIKEMNNDAALSSYQGRLDFELSIIEKMGFCGYFLIVSDFIQWARSQGIPIGPGRGSGAGSVVAWSLTITDMDPIRFGLIFERFLNPERVSMPDFDIDFCQDRRDEVIEYVCSKYGHDRVAHIITFGKLQARAVIKDVGRVLQIPYGQVDRISKLIPNHPGQVMTIKQALDSEPRLKEMRDDDPTVNKLISISIKLEGLYRHASTHAAGVVIADRPLTELIPLYKDSNSLLPATQFSMKYTELAGLIKFDFLGLKTLTIIKACVQTIQKTLDFKIEKIQLDDAKTFQLLCRVETIGVFQLESAGMCDVLRKLQPDRFEDIIALISLYRPGPMDDIPRYLACKHGDEEVRYLHPDLKSILEPTYGVMVYQEQVIQIAQVIGGYSLGSADLLRRAMGKKIKSEMDAQRQIFIEGSKKKGIDQSISEQLFHQMEKFAGYGFSKSHAAPYALLAYQTAFLKANYRKEFFAATMTYDQGNVDKLHAYCHEFKNIYPPDINFSYPQFVVEGDGIRYSLAALKNVGEQAMNHLVHERRKGKFKSLLDFTQRIDTRIINKRQLEYLICAGALDSLHNNRAELYESVDRIIQMSRCKDDLQGTLFQETQPVMLHPRQEWSFLEKLQKEFDAIGFYLTSHPLAPYKALIKGMTPSSLLESFTTSQAGLKLSGVILSKTEKISKHGNKYSFVTCSDLEGVFDVVFFSELFERVKEHLFPGNLVIVDTNLKYEEGSYRLIANDISDLKFHFVDLYIDESIDWLQLKQLCNESGDVTVTLIWNEVLIRLPLKIQVTTNLHVKGILRVEYR